MGFGAENFRAWPRGELEADDLGFFTGLEAVCCVTSGLSIVETFWPQNRGAVGVCKGDGKFIGEACRDVVLKLQCDSQAVQELAFEGNCNGFTAAFLQEDALAFHGRDGLLEAHLVLRKGRVFFWQQAYEGEGEDEENCAYDAGQDDAKFSFGRSFAEHRDPSFFGGFEKYGRSRHEKRI